jgi:hypothetical protein
MIATVLTAIPAALGGLMILAAVWEYMTWNSRFDKWRRGVGTSLGAVKLRGDVGPRLAYEFVVDGVARTAYSSRMRDVLPEKGHKISVFYDPADPDTSDWYDVGMHLFFVYGVAALGVLLVWMALF